MVKELLSRTSFDNVVDGYKLQDYTVLAQDIVRDGLKT